jgi:hypothetical protein
MAAEEPLEQGETVWLADASMSVGGTLNVPAPARRHLGIEDVAARLLVFAQPGRIILTLVPLADDLLGFAAMQAAAAKAEPDSDAS